MLIETDNGLQSCKLIAVHGGLERGKDVEEQIKYLKAKDTRIPKVEPLSGRKSVWDIPEVISHLNFHILSICGIFIRPLQSPLLTLLL